MGAAETYNTIIVSQEPRGRMFDGYVSGTPKPGTVMQQTSAAEVGGLGTYEAFNRAADGSRALGPLIVLLEDHLQGKGINDAYETGKLGHFYVPETGDELLMILLDVSGTGDAHTILEELMVDDGTGKLVAVTGTPDQVPFILKETLAAPTADVHALVQRTSA